MEPFLTPEKNKTYREMVLGVVPGARHLLPGITRSGASGTIVASRHPITTGAEQIVDWVEK